MPRLQPQIDRLYKQLNMELDNFPIGKRFFSIQEIMKRFQVNLRVINGALERLETENKITRERYRGIFSSVDRFPSSRLLLLAMPDFPSNELVSFGKLIQNYLIKNTEFRCSQRYLSLDRFTSLLSEQADALLLFGDAKPYSIEELMRLEKWGKPVVFFCRIFEDSPFSFVNFNNIEGGILACEYLLSHGCHNLLVIQTECPKNDIEERLNAFQTYAAIKGIPCLRLNCNTMAEESANAHAFATLTEHLNTYGCNFDGVFVDCYGSAPGVYAALTDYGLHIPNDVSVISFHGFGEDTFCRPALTTIGCRPEDIFSAIFLRLKSVFNREITQFHIQLPMYIMERDSVRSEGTILN